MKTCIACKESHDEPSNPLHQESTLRPNVFVHSQCLNEPAYSNWVAEQRARDPEYARYWDMMTYGLPHKCLGCGATLNLAPKAVGMGAGGWDVCCDACPRVLRNGISAYAHPEVFARLEAAREKFLIGRNIAGLKEELLALSAECDPLLKTGICTCGGQFSLAAPPRCPQCHAVAIDSCFHTVYVLEQS